jgi:hypothetical protein
MAYDIAIGNLILNTLMGLWYGAMFISSVRHFHKSKQLVGDNVFDFTFFVVQIFVFLFNIGTMSVIAFSVFENTAVEASVITWLIFNCCLFVVGIYVFITSSSTYQVWNSILCCKKKQSQL